MYTALNAGSYEQRDTVDKIVQDEISGSHGGEYEDYSLL
jgi:hypothetical protein